MFHTDGQIHGVGGRSWWKSEISFTRTANRYTSGPADAYVDILAVVVAAEAPVPYASDADVLAN